MGIMHGSLGRRTPSDWTHVDKYPLQSGVFDLAKPRPVVLGINWYSAFDNPEKASDGSYWIGRNVNLGAVRGGHCICLKPAGVTDLDLWWRWYDQGNEGACVGFGSSRMMSLYNGRRYYARWLWDHAKLIDEWTDTNPGDDNGTSVHASFDVLRQQGHVHFNSAQFYEWDAVGNYESRDALAPNPAEGISANRWATKASDVLGVLGMTGKDYVEVLNSWGTYYPHVTRMPASVLQRLLDEDGEAGVATDR